MPTFREMVEVATTAVFTLVDYFKNDFGREERSFNVKSVAVDTVKLPYTVTNFIPYVNKTPRLIRGGIVYGTMFYSLFLSPIFLNTPFAVYNQSIPKEARAVEREAKPQPPVVATATPVPTPILPTATPTVTKPTALPTSTPTVVPTPVSTPYKVKRFTELSHLYDTALIIENVRVQKTRDPITGKFVSGVIVAGVYLPRGDVDKCQVGPVRSRGDKENTQFIQDCAVERGYIHFVYDVFPDERPEAKEAELDATFTRLDPNAQLSGRGTKVSLRRSVGDVRHPEPYRNRSLQDPAVMLSEDGVIIAVPSSVLKLESTYHPVTPQSASESSYEIGPDKPTPTPAPRRN